MQLWLLSTYSRALAVSAPSTENWLEVAELLAVVVAVVEVVGEVVAVVVVVGVEVPVVVVIGVVVVVPCLKQATSARWWW